MSNTLHWSWMRWALYSTFSISWWWSPNFKLQLEAEAGKSRHQPHKGPLDGNGWLENIMQNSWSIQHPGGLMCWEIVSDNRNLSIVVKLLLAQLTSITKPCKYRSKNTNVKLEWPLACIVFCPLLRFTFSKSVLWKTMIC